mgnify:CR=1 FL=1
MKLGWVLEQLWEWNRKDGGEVMMRESPEMMGKQQNEAGMMAGYWSNYGNGTGRMKVK